MRVAYLDMRNSSHHCPSALTLADCYHGAQLPGDCVIQPTPDVLVPNTFYFLLGNSKVHFSCINH